MKLLLTIAYIGLLAFGFIIAVKILALLIAVVVSFACAWVDMFLSGFRGPRYVTKEDEQE